MLSKNKLKEMHKNALLENDKIILTIAILLHEINNKLNDKPNKTEEVKSNDKIRADSKGGKKA